MGEPAFEETLPEEELDDVERAVLGLYAALRAQVIAALEKQRTTALVAAAGDKPANPDVMDEGLFVTLSTDMLDALSDVLLDAAAGAKITIGWDVSDAALDRIVREHLNALENFAPYLRKRVADWITEGLREGWSIDDLVENLPSKSPLSERSARAVARTEAVAAANAGATEAWGQAGLSGFKRWMATNDLRTRDSHWDADGQTVPLEADFYVGGEAARYPGDPRLSPAQRANCRCTTVFVEESGNVRTLPVTRADLRQLARQRGLSPDGSNRQIRQRLVDALPDRPARAAALDGLSKKDLLERASASGIRGRSKMTKDELIEALKQEQAFTTHGAVTFLRERRPDGTYAPKGQGSRLGRTVPEDHPKLSAWQGVEAEYSAWEKQIETDPRLEQANDDLRSYCDEGYKIINTDLRDGYLGGSTGERATNIDHALDLAGPTTREITARRWVSVELSEKMQPGTEFRERGFMSTTLSPTFDGVDVTTPLPVTITIPPGVRAAYVGKNLGVETEREFLVGAGARLRIISNDGRGVVAEMVGQDPTITVTAVDFAERVTDAAGGKFGWDLDQLEELEAGDDQLAVQTFVRERRADGTYAPKGQGVPSIAGWKRVGPQGGSNPGGEFEAPDGTRYYVKGSMSPQHAQNEALAAELYTMAGVTVPEVTVVDLAGEFGDRKVGVASKIVDGEANLPSRYKDPAYADAIGKDMAVDAWLANWDTTGLGKDNIIEVDGKPHRVDVGGSLLYRAQGAPKGEAFGPKVSELDTLRNPQMNRDAADIFGRRNPGPDDLVFMDGARRVVDLPADDIARAVASKITDPQVAADLTGTLLARQGDIAARSGLRVNEASVLVGVQQFLRERYPNGRYAPKGRGGRKAPAQPKQELHGATEFLSTAEMASTKRKARAKVRNAPKPSDEHVAVGLKDAQAYRQAKAKGERAPRPGGDHRGNNTARRKRSEALMEEFKMPSGKTGCAHCGIVLKSGRKAKGKGAPLTQDKIVTGKQGGRYGLPNLIPSCSPCNKSRNQKVSGLGKPKWGDPEKNARRVARQLGLPYDKLDDFTAATLVLTHNRMVERGALASYAVARWSPHPPSSGSRSTRPTARFVSASTAGSGRSVTAGTTPTASTTARARWTAKRTTTPGLRGPSRSGGSPASSTGSSSSPASSSTPTRSSWTPRSAETFARVRKADGTYAPKGWTGVHYPKGDGPNPHIPYGATTEGIPLNAFGKPKKNAQPGDTGVPKSGKLAGQNASKKKPDTPITPPASAAPPFTPAPPAKQGLDDGPAHDTPWRPLEPVTHADAREVDAWWTSQEMDIAQAGITSEQAQAVKEYTGLAYADMNDVLRGREPTLGIDPELMKTRNRHLDRALAAVGPVPENIIVKRGVSGDYGKNLAALQPGDTFRDRGFVSTSTSTRGTDVWMNIAVPAGTRGAYVDELSQFGGEYEFLLGQGVRFKVLGTETYTAQGRQRTRVDVTIIEQAPTL